MIIDCHGHYTTAPRGLALWRDAQIAALNNLTHVPSKGAVNITDDQIRETLETWQLRLQRERGTDLVLFSPGAGRRAAMVNGFHADAVALCHRFIPVLLRHLRLAIRRRILEMTKSVAEASSATP